MTPAVALHCDLGNNSRFFDLATDFHRAEVFSGSVKAEIGAAEDVQDRIAFLFLKFSYRKKI